MKRLLVHVNIDSKHFYFFIDLCFILIQVFFHQKFVFFNFPHFLNFLANLQYWTPPLDQLKNFIFKSHIFSIFFATIFICYSRYEFINFFLQVLPDFLFFINFHHFNFHHKHYFTIYQYCLISNYFDFYQDYFLSNYYLDYYSVRCCFLFIQFLDQYFYFVRYSILSIYAEYLDQDYHWLVLYQH